jgi:4'-phosphopantetheinyl transferase
MRAHGVLRCLLGGYVGLDARALRFTRDAGGKPTVSEHPPAATAAGGMPSQARLGERRQCRVAFSVSHTGALGLFGFVCSGEIGVDVELIGRARLDEVALAARMLGSGEAKRLSELEPQLRRREFLRAWTRREAQVKWSGAGLVGTADARAASPAAPVATSTRRAGKSARSASAVAEVAAGAFRADKAGAPGPGPGGRESWLGELDMGPACVAAVALSRTPEQLLCWDWNATRLLPFVGL